MSSGTVRVPLYKLYRLWGFAGGGTTHEGGCVNNHPKTCLLEITRHTPCPHSFESGTQERLSWRVWLWVLVKTESCCQLGGILWRLDRPWRSASRGPSPHLWGWQVSAGGQVSIPPAFSQCGGQHPSGE